MKPRMGYLLSSVLILAVATAAFTQSVVPTVSPDESKAIAPTFTLTSLDGQRFDLVSLRGKVVVLNFWGTFCPPCIDDIPQLNDLVDEFKGKDVVFIAPAMDDVPTLQSFLKKVPFKFHVVPSAADLIVRTYGDGEGAALPMHIVINKSGEIETKIKGKLVTRKGTKQLDDLRAAIEHLVKATPDKTK